MQNTDLKTLIIIPARYASTRYPGKPLAMLKGATGEKKTLIQRSWEAACAVKGASRVVVATDSVEIKIVAEGFGAEVVMTSDKCRNGTERCAEVASMFPDYDVYVNLQGDAPLTPAVFVEQLVSELASSEASVATPALLCDAATLQGLLEDRRQGRVGGTTVVFNGNQNAMYFSKEVIPHVPDGGENLDGLPVYHHVGVYAYRKAALDIYSSIPPSQAEKMEGLEQLRFLECGAKIHCAKVPLGYHFWELNNPTDVPLIESYLAKAGIE